MLLLKVRVGDRILIGEDIEIFHGEINQKPLRIAVNAPNLKIRRFDKNGEEYTHSKSAVDKTDEK